MISFFCFPQLLFVCFFFKRPPLQYGFGLIDAGAAVAMAHDSNRQNLPPNVDPAKVLNRVLPAQVPIPYLIIISPPPPNHVGVVRLQPCSHCFSHSTGHPG